MNVTAALEHAVFMNVQGAVKMIQFSTEWGSSMIAIMEDLLEEIKRAWEHCGFVISDEEIFEIAEEVGN